MRLFLICLMSFSFSIHNSAEAEVNLEDKLQMYFDFLGKESFDKLILPLKKPNNMYLSYVHMSYDLNKSKKMQKSIGITYSIKEKYKNLSKYRFPANFSVKNQDFPSEYLDCKPFNSRFVNLYHKNSQKKLRFCYKSDNSKITSHEVNLFLNASVRGLSLDKTTFIQYLQTLAPASQFYKTFYVETVYPVSRLQTWKNQLPFDQQGLWFFEKYILPEFKETIYVPVDLPPEFRFSHVGFHLKYLEKGIPSPDHLGFAPDFSYMIQGDLNENIGSIRYNVYPRKSCADLKNRNFVAVKFFSENFGQFTVCTNQTKSNSPKPNQMYNHYLVAPGKTIQMSGFNMSLKTFTQIVDKLRPIN